MTKQAALLLLIKLLFIAGSSAQCDEDYSPCICAVDSDLLVTVNCIEVSPAEIKAAFNRTTTQQVFNVVFILTPDAGQLPSDLLAGKEANIINIIGSGRDTFELSVAVDVFSSSSAVTQQLTILNCGLASLDFTFLKGFSKLIELRLDSTANISAIQALPTLPSLTGLAIDNSLGFKDLTDFPARALSRLERLYLFNDELTDVAVDIILNAFLDSFSLNTLRFLGLGDNRLSKVPSQIPAFVSLADLSLNNNNISVIETNQITFGGKVENLLLRYNLMLSVQPGAFIGDFTDAQVVLDHNLLTEFTADVFQAVLDQMITGNGTMVLNSNPFTCDCGLAWLVRDNRHLLAPLSGATCSNGTLFEQLDPYGYYDC